MKDQLNLVRGAVSKKDLVPVLTAFHIYDGRIQGMNGFVVIDTTCKELADVNITIPAERFIRAVDACENEPTFKLTEKSLLVQGKKLKVTIPLMVHDKFPKQEREGKGKKIKGLLEILKLLHPFIAEDATRPWACGVLLSGDHAYATNNVSIARIPFKSSCKSVIVPLHAINELLRIKQDPKSIAITDSWITFELQDCWLKVRQIEGEWPQVDDHLIPCKKKAPAGLMEEVELLAKFVNKGAFPTIGFTEDKVLLQGGNAEFKREGLPKGSYRAEPLITCLQVATHIDFEKFPKVPFKGKDGLMGILMGLHE